MGITQHVVPPQLGKLVPIEVSTSGTKRSHEIDSSNIDNDLSQIDGALQLDMINPNHNVWIEFKKKKVK